MKKVLLFIALLSLTISSYGQYKHPDGYYTDINPLLTLSIDTCGTWSLSDTTITSWKDEGPICKCFFNDQDWVYSKWEAELGLSTYIHIWGDCSDPKHIDYQRRISRSTGVIQVIKRIWNYTYTPKPKDEYLEVYKKWHSH